MDRMIFVNLPVKDLTASTSFYLGLGFTKNDMFSDDQCSAVVISDTIVVMLLTEKRFSDFVVGDVLNEKGATEVINCLSASTRAEVDDLYERALAAGGSEWKGLMQEGPMYGNSFADPDGHVWEVLHMDLTAV
ncbi:MAG TPA: VOC family protein [Actinomycetales bacterium]|nr:VOC family protein [Actinomycetales bacterium]